MAEMISRFRNPYFAQHQTGRRSRWQEDWWAYLGCLVLLALLGWYGVVKRQWLWLDTIQINGNSYLTTDQVTSATNEALNKKHWLVVPQRFYPLTNETKLGDDISTILQQRIGIAELSAATHFPDNVSVTLKERVPGYVYILNNQYYYLDDAGAVTSSVKANALDPKFPHIRDRNKKRPVALNAVALRPSVMDFISQLVEKFTAQTHLDISEFAVLPVTCQAKQYVAEKIFADEIEGTKDASIKQQKKDILKRLQSNEITVDQSLSLLEEIKRSEGGDQGNTKANGSQAIITWEAQYVDTPCDFVTVIQDVAVVTQPGTAIYFDSTIDLDQQLNHLALLLEEESIDPTKTEYIDVRFDDRAYYK